MQRLLAISWLTLKAAFRFKLVLVLALILIGGVVFLPMVIKDDGTARGFTQILLTYTLSLITATLGFATLWLACGTLARDVEECQMQMVAVKPIARWQIWLGKWLGILAVNALLLGLSGAAVYFMMQWRAQRLPEAQQAILRNEVLVARGSAREPVPDYAADAERILQDRLAQSQVAPGDLDYIRKQIVEQVKAQYQVVPSGYQREWNLDLGLIHHFLKDQPLFLRIKFNSAEKSPSGTFLGMWQFGDPQTPFVQREIMNLAPDTFHELKVNPNLFNEQGILRITFINRNDAALLFSFEEGLELLYREGGFAMNFVRGLGIILLWLMFLSTIGLAAASFLSFPVAAFVSLGILIMGLSSGTISQVLEQGTVLEVNHETGVADKKAWIDHIALPLFQGLLHLITLVRGFSPIDALSSGRSIPWGELAQAFAQICLLLSGLIAAFGIYVFQRRELATAQGTQ